MAVVGSLQLLAFGFDAEGVLPSQLVERLQWLSASSRVQLLDALLVSRSDEGVLREEQSIGLEVSSTPAGSTLRPLFDDPDVDAVPTAPLELRSSAEVGLDLDAVENFADRIAPGTSALLLLAEPRWAKELVDVVVPSGAFPLAFGCLEPETMLVIGPQVAAAAREAEAVDLAAAASGSATLDAMASARVPSSVMAAGIIRALLVAGVIRPADVDRVVNSLERAELISTPDHRLSAPRSRIRPASDRQARSGTGDGTPIARVQTRRDRSEAPSTSVDPPAPDGDLSLEVRWILPGPLPPEMIEWFGTGPGGVETRRDTYLAQRTGPDVGVKVRDNAQLDVKVYEGSPDVVTVLGRAHGRLGWWRKWSFPLRAGDRQREPAGWASVQKVHRIRLFSLAGRPILTKADARVEGGCAVELTQVTFDRRRWWTLGFEAIGPAVALTDELNASVAVMFDHPLPAGLILDLAHSTSYPEWLAADWQGGPRAPLRSGAVCRIRIAPEHRSM